MGSQDAGARVCEPPIKLNELPKPLGTLRNHGHHFSCANTDPKPRSKQRRLR